MPRREEFSNLHPSLVHLRFRRPFRDPENLADLAVLEALDVVEQEHGLTAFRKVSQGGLDVQPAHRKLSVTGSGGLLRMVVLERGRRLLVSSRLAAKPIQTEVHSQSVKPSAKRRVAFEAIELSEGQQENLLKEVFCVLGAAAHAASKIVEAACVLLIQIFECAKVPGAAPFDQRRVGCPRLYSG